MHKSPEHHLQHFSQGLSHLRDPCNNGMSPQLAPLHSYEGAVHLYFFGHSSNTPHVQYSVADPLTAMRVGCAGHICFFGFLRQAPYAA